MAYLLLPARTKEENGILGDHFPYTGMHMGSIKREKNTTICIHATFLLFSVPQNALNMLGDGKKELMRLPSP